MIFLKINNKSVASPKDINYSYEILDKTERTLNGTLVVDIVGKKRTVNITWDYLTKENMTTISTELNSSSFQDVLVYDTTTGETTTMVGKVNEFTFQPGYDWVHNKLKWTNVSLTFVER